MRPDVVDLNGFYTSRLGQAARRVVRRELRALWPKVTGETVVGIGYATPFLGLFREEAVRALALMPASQGVLAWPTGRPRLVALAEEADLPLPDECADRILLVHALEFAEQTEPLMREVWRILRPEGLLLAIVPNRRSLWARVEGTPFGHGRPFSGSQLSRLLRDHRFDPVRTEATLYLPPVQARLMLRAGGLWDRLGRLFGKPFGGVVLVEAKKRLYGARPVAKRVRRRVLVPLPGSAVPASARAHLDLQ
jgi:SAM-dependent methyltransferase